MLRSQSSSGTTLSTPLGGFGIVPHAEEVVLTIGLVALDVDDGIDGLLVDRHQAASGMAHGIEGTSLDEGLNEPLVAHRQADLVKEAEEIGGRAILLTRPDDLRDGVGTDIADSSQAEPDVLTDSGELQRGGVDVGRQDIDVLGPHVGQVHRHLVLVVTDAGQQGGSVLGRVIGLEIGRPVGDQSVTGSMGLVEGCLLYTSPSPTRPY